MTRYRAYLKGEYRGSMSARNKAAVQAAFAKSMNCKPDEIDVRSPAQLSPAEEALKEIGLLKEGGAVSVRHS